VNAAGDLAFDQRGESGLVERAAAEWRHQRRKNAAKSGT
jgi:hypothetical protein